MRILDLFCCAGGAAMGYHHALEKAGIEHEIVGIDLEDQPNYPFAFARANALDVLRASLRHSPFPFDFIHASPPCQAYGAQTKHIAGLGHPELIDPVRRLLERTSVPWVIENVIGAPLNSPLMLCGSMMNPVMSIQRHRLFETCNFAFPTFQARCRHELWKNRYPTHARKDKPQWSPVVHIYGTGGGSGKDLSLWRTAMEVPWMKTKHEVSEAIPPRYTEYVMNLHLGRV